MVTRALTFAFLFATSWPLLAEGEILIPKGSPWRYLADGSDQHGAWRDPAFDDSDWPEGEGPIGYGSSGLGTTLPVPPPPRPITLYFRHAFTLDTDPAADIVFVLRLRRDDGAAVSLNGVELRRDNMAAGPLDFRSTALTTVSGAEGLGYHETFHFLTGLARRGRNVMAVELHGADSGSADAVFDLELERLAAPLASFLSPPPAAVTFEHPELQTIVGTGAVRRLHPTYAGWDYTHQRIPDGQYTYNDVYLPLDRSLFTGAPFPSFVFCLSYHSRDLRTAPAAVANFREVAVSVDLLAEHVGPFGEEDRLRVDLFVAVPGGFGNHTRIPWLEIGAPGTLSGEAPVALPPESLVSPNATFTRFTTPPGMIPDSALTVIVRIVARSASAHTAFYLDNLSITGTAIEPHDYASFMRIRGGAPSVPPPNGDWDADGLENFLEYALGGDPFVAGGTPSPSLDFSPDGFVEFTHPLLAGDLAGDADRGLQVADVRYRGQFSPDGRHWFDGLGASVFALLPASPDRPHTIRLRSLFPLGREHATGLFRVRVEAAPPLRGSLPLADPFATPLFEP